MSFFCPSGNFCKSFGIQIVAKQQTKQKHMKKKIRDTSFSPSPSGSHLQCVGSFPTPSSNYPIPAVCPTVQLQSDTMDMEIVSGPTD